MGKLLANIKGYFLLCGQKDGTFTPETGWNRGYHNLRNILADRLNFDKNVFNEQMRILNG